eukprot:5950404-Prymnesium_polylepis.1
MGDASFARGPTPNSAVFTGQLKKKTTAPEPYIIPLLCDFETFAHGMAVLRSKQHETLEPAQI